MHEGASCTHTVDTTDTHRETPWWIVDLQAESVITEVWIRNRDSYGSLCKDLFHVRSITGLGSQK